jgi:hypothetical protein
MLDLVANLSSFDSQKTLLLIVKGLIVKTRIGPAIQIRREGS